MFARFSRWLRGAPPESLGERGERAAERYLRRRGFAIVARRERDALGEVDLIAVEDRTVVFVEVKTRRTHATGHPAEAVDEPKQRRLTRAALAYLKRHKLLEHAYRFDIVAVTWPAGERRPKIEHFPNAFEPVGRNQFFS